VAARQREERWVYYGSGMDIGPFPDLVYSAVEHGWLAKLADGTEIFVRGNRREPELPRLLLAREVAAHFDLAIAAAEKYLNHFVAQGTVGGTGEWTPVALEFGRSRRSDLREYEVLMNRDGDNYGLWNVGVMHSPGLSTSQFTPTRFGRRQT